MPYHRRRQTRSPEEISLLISLVSPHIRDLEQGAPNSIDSRKRRGSAWLSIAKDYNTLKKTSRSASTEDLRGMWYRIKTKAKKDRLRVGPTVPLKDKLASAAEKLLEQVASTRTPFQTPPHLAPDDSDGEGYKSSETGRSGHESRPASQSSAVDYCPRKQFRTTPADSTVFPISDNRAPPSLKDQRRAFAPPTSAPGPSGRPADQTLPPTLITSTFHNAANSSPIMRSPAHSNVAFFQQGVNPVLPNSYTGPVQINTLWPSPQHQFGSAQSPLRPTPQTTAIPADDPARSQQLLQNMQAQLQIRHVQSTAAMEKAIYEHKMRSYEVTANLAQKLHETQIRATATTSEGKLAMEKIMLKRDEELHEARMRSEEEILSMQRELHDMRMETARLELKQAEIAKQVVKVKLEQVELELSQFKGGEMFPPRPHCT